MVPVDVAASDDVAVTRVELFIDNRWYATATTAPYQFVIDASGLAPGQHKLRAYAYDASENVGKTKTRKISSLPAPACWSAMRSPIDQPSRSVRSSPFRPAQRSIRALDDS